jgi:monovalent cation:H+ antiporter-2, CPA2 family
MALEFESTGLRDALIILGAAGLVIPTFARFKITPVIGFILVGILVGPFGLSTFRETLPALKWMTIGDTKAVNAFGEFGIILLLFSVGLELSLPRLWSMRRRVFGFGAIELFGAALLIAIGLWLFDTSPGAAIGLGVALSLSSTALVLPIAGVSGPVGRLAFPMLLFEDLALVPIIFALGAIGGNAGGTIGAFGQTVGLGILTVATLFVIGRFAMPPLFAQAARTKSPELFLSATLLIIILASLLTTVIGLSPIVGALVAGLLIAETDYRSEVETITTPFRGLALGIFLITVGMSLDLPMIARNWSQIILAVAAVVVIKALVTMVLLRMRRVKPGIAAEVAVLMASPSETTLIVLAAAAHAALISSDTAAFWQVVTAIGLTITPLLARIGHDLSRRMERTEHTLSDAEQAAIAVPHTIIIGYGRVGQMVADMLDRHGRPWIALEENIDVVSMARRAGKPVHYGDARRMASIEALNPDIANAIVLTMDDPVQTVRIVKHVRERLPNLPISARARDTEHAAQLYRAGASDAVPETLESSLQLAESVLVDIGIAVGPVIASIHEKRDELRTAIRRSSKMSASPRLKSRERS